MNYTKIFCCVNGWQAVNVSDDGAKETIVYEGSDTEDSAEIEAFCRLLEDLVNTIGPSTSRYSKHRIQISIVKGDKS